MSPAVTALRLYPVKSCGPVILERAFLGARGMESGKIGDRRWMLVDQAGIFVSQRTEPALARVTVSLIEGQAVRLHTEGWAPLILVPGEVEGGRGIFTMHGRQLGGYLAPAAASAWFSGVLGYPVKLIHQTDDEIRLLDPNFAVNPETDHVGLADAYPYLVAGEGTLAKLNGRLAEPVPMNRFRPSIVVGPTPPDAEYGWGEIAIGEARLSLVKPCTRCVMTTVDQDLGIKTGKEPLAALGRHYHLTTSLINGAIFGENAVATMLGEVAVGDAVRVLSTRAPHAFRNPKERGRS
jgi:uncharacterized protein YcbX